MPIYTIDDDDDFPRLSRNDLVRLRELLIKIEEAGGINILTDGEVMSLKQIVSLIALPGVTEMLMEASERHKENVLRAKIRARWASVRTRWFAFIAWLAGVMAAIAVFISQMDGMARTVRRWFE